MVGIHHGLPYLDYRSAEGISQSELKVLLEFSPLHFQHYQTAERKKLSKCLRVGDATHHLILQPSDWDNTVAVLPGKWKDYRTKAAQAWRAENLKRGLKVLNRHEAYDVNKMCEAIRRHPYAGPLLSRGQPEVSAFAIDPETGLLRKGRFDWLTDPSLIADGPVPMLDVKTCESASPHAFGRAVRKLKYYLQAGYYLDLASALGLPHTCFIIVAIESSPPFAVECYQVGPQSLELGRQEYRKALGIYKACTDEGKWPGYNSGINVMEIV